MSGVWSELPSPVGKLLLTAEGNGLTGLYMLDGEARVAIRGERDDADPWLVRAKAQLDAYFAGRLKVFTVPLAARGTTFQRRVWAQLMAIPYGATISYGELARRLGQPKATRAVGAANGRNPVSIIVPCHRVIGTDGSLTGYGGGLERKRWLLAHERRLASTIAP